MSNYSCKLHPHLFLLVTWPCLISATALTKRSSCRKTIKAKCRRTSWISCGKEGFEEGMVQFELFSCQVVSSVVLTCLVFAKHYSVLPCGWWTTYLWSQWRLLRSFLVCGSFSLTTYSVRVYFVQLFIGLGSCLHDTHRLFARVWNSDQSTYWWHH